MKFVSRLFFAVICSLLFFGFSSNYTMVSQSQTCTTELDIIILLDYSASLRGEEDNITSFALSFVESFDISATGARFGLAWFDGSIRRSLDLTDDLDSIRDELTRSDSADGFDTRIDRALEEARDMLSRDGRDDSGKAVIVLSDGLTGSEDRTRTIANDLRSSGVSIFGVLYPVFSIDPDGEQLMQDISNRVFTPTATDRDALLAIVEELVSETCVTPEPTTPSPTPVTPAPVTPTPQPTVVAIVPTQPPMPECADIDGSISDVVRAFLSPTATTPYCNIIAERGSFVRSSAEVGIQSVLERGVIHAVDVFTVGGSATGTTICLQGTGDILFLDASTSPRTVVPLAMFANAGFTCSTLPSEGTVVLVQGNGAPPASAPQPETSTQGTVLTGCQVTTNNILNLRSDPNMNGDVLEIVPYNTTLQATERVDGWIKVIYLDMQGWLSADFLQLSGSCG